MSDSVNRLVRSALGDIRRLLDYHARSMTDAEWVDFLAGLRSEVGDRQTTVGDTDHETLMRYIADWRGCATSEQLHHVADRLVAANAAKVLRAVYNAGRGRGVQEAGSGCMG